MNDENTKILHITEMLKMPTARMSCFAFFASCAVELTAGGWSSSFFVNTKGVTAEHAAQIAMLFYIGLALGRFVSGIASKKFTRWQIIVTSSLVMLVSIVLLLLPLSTVLSSVSLLFIGFGIGPLYLLILGIVYLFSLTLLIKNQKGLNPKS